MTNAFDQKILHAHFQMLCTLYNINEHNWILPALLLASKNKLSVLTSTDIQRELCRPRFQEKRLHKYFTKQIEIQ